MTLWGQVVEWSLLIAVVFLVDELFQSPGIHDFQAAYAQCRKSLHSRDSEMAEDPPFYIFYIPFFTLVKLLDLGL